MTANKTLVFSEYAWTKIRWFLRKSGKNEFSGFGVTAEDDPFFVQDFRTIDQENTGAETELDDVALAKYLGAMSKEGIEPHRCMRVWIHSHPFATSSPHPSAPDIKTWGKKLGEGDWTIMVIIGKKMCITAMMSVKLAIPGSIRVELDLDVEVDWGIATEKAHSTKWTKEFKANIHEAKVEAIVLADSNRKFGFNQTGKSHKGKYFNRMQDSDGVLGFGGYPGYQPPYKKYMDEWSDGESLVNLSYYAAARDEGYSASQIETFNLFVFQQQPAKPTRVYYEHLVIDAPTYASSTEAVANLDGMAKNGNKKRQLQTPPGKHTPKQVRRALKKVREAQKREQATQFTEAEKRG